MAPPSMPKQVTTAYTAAQTVRMSPAEKPKPFITAATVAPTYRKTASPSANKDHVNPNHQKPSSTIPFQPTTLRRQQSGSREKSADAATSIQGPISELGLRGDAAESSAFDETDDALSGLPVANAYAHTGKRSRRGKQYLQQKSAGGMLSDGFGGNQVTPPRGGGRKQKTKRYQQNGQDEDGWATEDVTDIKDTEFDFQGNLDRFDKKTVFSQIKVSCFQGAEN